MHLALVLTLAVAQAPQTQASPSPAPGARLSGMWSLNTDKSDDARDKMRQGSSGNGGGGGGYGGGHGGGGFGGHGMGGGGMGGGGHHGGGIAGGATSDSDRAAIRSLMDGLVNPPSDLAIDVQPTEVTLTPGDKPALHLHADGKKVKADDGSSLERKARWDGTTLVVETQVGSTSLKDRYSVTPDGSLQVIEHLDRSSGRALDLTRIYDASTPGPTSSASPAQP